MPKAFQPTVLTANHLTEGHSVFLGAEGWTRQIVEALVATTPEQAEELEALGNRHASGTEVVGPYLVEISLDDGAPVPTSRREQIRASGEPTVPVGEAARSQAA